MASPRDRDSAGPSLNLTDASEHNGHSNVEVISGLYEELFENEVNDRPCYLPDSGNSGQEDRTSTSHDCHGGAEDDINYREMSGQARRDNVNEKGESISVNGSSTSARMESDNRETGNDTGDLHKDGAMSSSENEGEAQDINQDLNHGNGVGAEDSSILRSIVLDGELSTDRGLDCLPSPSSSRGGSSGYMHGSGSSSASITTGSVSGVERGADQESEANGSSKEQGVWVPGKRYPDEDDTRSSWRGHKKHFFILSNAGKPIYSRYGDEHKLAGFSATLQAIMSFVQNSGDLIHLVRAGDHQIIFLVRGPLYLVCISSTDEPFQVLKSQVELLHEQLVLILTKGVEKCFMKNSKFDMRPLLGGTEVVFSSLIHGFSWDPATFLQAYTCLPLPYATRQTACVALQDLTDSGTLFALLMCGTKVISLVGPRKNSLHPHDLLLLSNFITSSESFRTSESFSPVCLPRYNATAFMYAYVQYLDKDVCLILLTGDSDDFFGLKECRARIETVLRESDVLREATNSVVRGGLRVEDLPEAESSLSYDRLTGREPLPDGATITSRLGAGGDAGLWHFIYRSTYLDQYVASEFSPPLHSRASQKRLFRAYQKLHASMHDIGAAGPHKMQYRRDEYHVLLSWRTSDFELYAAFDPLAEKSAAITVCNRVCQWIRDIESEIFLLGATPFNW